MANCRLTDATLEACDLRGRRVVDIGCGDGAYTIGLFDRAQPLSVHGVDPAPNAIEAARQRAGALPVTFSVGSAYDLPFENDSFDLAHVRGVLHHLDNPALALREAFRVAPRAIVLEPNGYNLGLKLIERLSRYHRQHREKSYAPRALDRWVREVGARPVARQFVGLVPFFCPDWVARALKAVEPAVEGLPLVNRIACAVYILVARRA
jgi:ubiquinone/menaquinone biosynthesis C-methylase UbiE